MLLSALGSVLIVKNCDLGHSFSLHGPLSRPITYLYTKQSSKTHLYKRKSYNSVNFKSWASEQSCPVFNKLTWHEPVIQSKTSTWSAFNFKKHMTSMSCKLEPATWSRDTGQRIPCLDRRQLIITWTSNIKEVHGKPRLHVSVNLSFGVWPPCCATPSSPPSPSCVRAHEQHR